jgi:hypothetical protein
MVHEVLVFDLVGHATSAAQPTVQHKTQFRGCLQTEAKGPDPSCRKCFLTLEEVWKIEFAQSLRVGR